MGCALSLSFLWELGLSQPMWASSPEQERGRSGGRALELLQGRAGLADPGAHSNSGLALGRAGWGVGRREGLLRVMGVGGKRQEARAQN